MTSHGWFVGPPRPDAAAILFCLPHAGGSGRTSFTGWTRQLPVDIDVQPLCLPGRDHRIAEPLRIDPIEIADAIAMRADRPYALYGHSMGARIAFDVIRVLRDNDRTLPVRCYVGAARPPDTADEMTDAVRLPDDQFVARLARLGGISDDMLAEPELMALILPILRADLGWLHDYRYRTQAPLPMPVVAFAGTDDHEVNAEVMAGWRRHTTGGFRLSTVPGGHFFPTQSLPELAGQIAADLLPAARSAGSAEEAR